jgi:hypothetical protein
MVVGFTTTCVNSAYHHWCCEFESRSGRGEYYYVIKCFSDLRQVGSFLRVLQLPPPMKTDRHDITEILLRVALNTIKQPNKQIKPNAVDLHWVEVEWKQKNAKIPISKIDTTNTKIHDLSLGQIYQVMTKCLLWVIRIETLSEVEITNDVINEITIDTSMPFVLCTITSIYNNDCN